MKRPRIILSPEERCLICKYDQQEDKENQVQHERDLEQELIEALQEQGYEYVKIRNENELKANLRKQLERLNRHSPRKETFSFSDSEWNWFYREYLEGVENEGFINRTKKIQGHEFKKLLRRDNGTTLNINFIDKINTDWNHLQVINQYSDSQSKVRYDVTILVNGLPLVHIELKKRGNSIKDAFNQIERYKRCGFSKLFEFIQIFVISNGTSTKYYSNTTRNNEDSNSFLFTSFWASFDNNTIKDLRDFSRTFLSPNTIIQVLTKYCVLDSDNNLKILRPYQIAAIEGITENIRRSIESKSSGLSAGGYVWHTTGSGKTLTSFKAAQLSIEIPEVKKVLFVVDRKDLDHQTTKEYRKFLGESEEQTIDSTNDTNKLRELLHDGTKRIIITTIQKLRLLLDRNRKNAENMEQLNDETKNQRIVMIMDECHRSQTEYAHELISSFRNRCVFGFTGTPKFVFKEEEGVEVEEINLTENTFGKQIHSYKIIDAIHDENVLGFWIDYVGERKALEEHTDHNVPESPSRISSIVQYIIDNFHVKANPTTNLTNDIHEVAKKGGSFNSMFAVKSIDAAIHYYKEFQEQLAKANKNLKIAIIFSTQDSHRTDIDLDDENIDDMQLNHREFLDKAINKYNQDFECNINKNNFNDYRNDISKRVKNKEIDILIVVNMFLTGFDAKKLNTIWIDKNLEGHNLIQAFSRTNRIYDKTKPHGNIVCFRDLKEQVDKALTKFAAYGTDKSCVVVQGLKESLEEFRGVEDKIINEFPIDQEIIGEDAEKEFVKTWKKYMEISSRLSCDEDFEKHRQLTPEQRQDYSSLYRGIFEKYQKMRESSDGTTIDIFEKEDISFDLELLRSDEVDVDYILSLLANYWKFKNRDVILRYVRTSSVFRPEEKMIVEFFDKVDAGDKNLTYQDWKKSKLEEQINNLIAEEGLKEEGTKKFMNKCRKLKDISFDGTKIKTDIMPEMNFILQYKEYNAKWKRVREKIEDIFRLMCAW